MGYVGMTDLVIGQNREFQRLAAEELGRRGLGPFTPVAAGASAPPAPVPPDEAHARLAEAQAAERSARPPGALSRAFGALPRAARLAAVPAALVLATALGVQWETGGREMGLAARLGLHAWILAAMVLAFVAARRLRDRYDHESFALGAAFAVLVAVGALTERVVALL